MVRRRAVVQFGILAALGVPAAVGMVDAQTPTFEVVSVKQDRSGILGGAGDWVPGTHGPSHGRWRWTRISLLRVIADAYDVKWEQVVGIPKAFEGPDTVFNIDAKFPPETSTAQFRLMLQSLLADRFHFAMHRETRERPAIALEVAKGGLKLKAASGDCVERPTKAPPDEYRCGVLLVLLRSGTEPAWEYVGRSVSLGDIAAGFRENDPVVDSTGVRGLFDIDVKVPFQQHPASDDANERLNNEIEFQAGLKSSFEKQAGLTIDLGKRKKLPVPVIVVDHVELPTPN